MFNLEQSISEWRAQMLSAGGMAVAHGHVFIACTDGVLRCFGAKK